MVSTKKATGRRPATAVTPEAPVQPAVLTRAEAARYLRISVRQLVRLVRAGQLAEISMNHVTRRYRREDLDAFTASCRVPAKEAA